jgi:hypothetical protein
MYLYLVKEVREHLNLFYAIEDDKLIFNGFEVYAGKESKHLAKYFLLDELEVITELEKWCRFHGMTKYGWIISAITGLIRKGETNMDAGYVYAPYIPLQLETPQIDLNNYQPSQGLASRYTRVQVNNDFYGQINIEDLP